MKILRHPLSIISYVMVFSFAIFMPAGQAQNFSAAEYLRRCLAFEQASDFAAAEQACISAEQLEANNLDIELALARVRAKLGAYSQARSSLNDLTSKINSAEPFLLLAEIALFQESWDEARSYLNRAESRLRSNPNPVFEGNRYYYLGQLDEREGRYSEAFSNYARAIATVPNEPRYRLAQAELSFLSNSPKVSEQLEAYLLQMHGVEDAETLLLPYRAEIYSLLGKDAWQKGEWKQASRYLGAAASNRSNNEQEARDIDNWQRGLVFLRLGDSRSANLSFREAFASGALLSKIFFNLLPWLVLLILFVGLQLFGESLVASTSTLEVVEGARAWTAQHAYTILGISLLTSLLATAGYSLLVYNNILAVFTPMQGTNVIAFFYICLSLIALLLSLILLQRLGWLPVQRILKPDSSQKDSRLSIAIMVGVGLVALTVAYLYFAPDRPGLSGFYLDYQRIRPLTVLASFFLPLLALFLHTICQKSFAERYNTTIAVSMVACLYALLMVAPLVLMLLVGLALAFFFLKTHSGLNVLLAWWIYQLGLLLLFSASAGLRILTL